MDLRMDSVVRIHNENSFWGTGFLVHRTKDASFVMTCEHVIRKTPVPRIFFPNGKVFDASIVKEDASTDLALLRYITTSGSGSPRALQLSPPGAPYVGPVELIAYFVKPGSVPLRPGLATGLTIGEPTPLPENPSPLKIPCNISNEVDEGGTSGGPLMAEEIVIGVHTAGAGGVKYSVMAKDIYETLRKWSKATKEGIEISEMLDMIAAETCTASSLKQ